VWRHHTKSHTKPSPKSAPWPEAEPSRCALPCASVYLYLHDVTRDLGPIELVPASHPWNKHDLPALEPELCARPEAGALDCRGLGDAGARRYAASGLPFHAERLRAGSLLVHEASVLHRGLANTALDVRYAVRFDLFALGDPKASTLASDPGTYHGQPAEASYTRGYTQALYRALSALRLRPPEAQAAALRAALDEHIVRYSALTMAHVHRASTRRPVVWIAAPRTTFDAARGALTAGLSAATSAQEGAQEGGVVAVYLDPQDAEAAELMLSVGAKPSLLGLQLLGSVPPLVDLPPSSPPPSSPPQQLRPKSSLLCGALPPQLAVEPAVLAEAVRSFAEAVHRGGGKAAVPLTRSAAEPAAPPVEGAPVVVVRSVFNALVRRAGVPVLLLLHISGDCCSGTTWRCDPCEEFEPVYSQLARRFNGGGAGAGSAAAAATGPRVAKMDLRSNGLPEDVTVERLPCLKLFTGTGGAGADVPPALYREEEHALLRLTEYLEGYIGRADVMGKGEL
jgi:hypothetical protein